MKVISPVQFSRVWFILFPLWLAASAAELPAAPVRMDLSQPWQVTSGRLPGELSAGYSVYRVGAAPQGGLRWVFVPRGETAELFTAGRSPAPATVYRATVSLDSDGPATAALGSQSYAGAWQRGEAVALAKRAPVVLSVATVSAPSRRLALCLTGLRAGQKYVVDWRAADGDPSEESPLPGADATTAAGPLRLDSVRAILDAETLEPDYVPTAEGTPRVYRLPAPCAFAPYGQGADVWLGEGQYDYRDLDRRLAALTARDPQARVLLQVALDSPPWWEAQHPEALIPAPPTSPELVAERKLTHASWYSPTWRAAARQALVNLVTHVQTGPWAGHVLGYELGSGRGGRWVPWHQTASLQEAGPLAQAAFRQWLQKKYGSLAALRVAWGQPRQPVMDAPEVKAGHILTQWGQIPVPAATYLLDPKSPTLYDPSGQQNLADYQQFLGEFTADVLLELVRAGREVTGPGGLWGACYGHLLWWPEGDWPPSLAGHLGLGKLLAAEEIGFLVGPPGATQSPTTPANSVLLRGKAYLEQPAESVARVLLPTSGSGRSPVLFRTAAQAERTIIESPGEFDGTPGPPPSWALVIEERSLSHLSPGSDLQWATLQGQAGEMYRMAWPDAWLAGDLPAAGVYGGYVMAATYYVPNPLREALLQRTRPGTVVVWLYAAGTLDDGWIDPSAIFRLTGIKATLLGSAGSLRIEVPPGEPLLTLEATRPLQWGPRLAVQPRFVLIAGDETVGSLEGSHWPGLGLKWDQRAALTVYSAAPGVPGEALASLQRGARRQAGLGDGGKPGVYPQG